MPKKSKAESGLGKQIIGAVIVAILVGGSAPWWWRLVVGEASEAESVSIVRIGTINSKHPDYVDLVTSSPHSIDTSNYRICEQDPGEQKDSCYSLPAKSIVAPGSPFRVFFFSPKDADKRAMAEEYRRKGHAVEASFGIAAGELVVLYGADGTKLDEKQAR